MYVTPVAKQKHANTTLENRVPLEFHHRNAGLTIPFVRASSKAADSLEPSPILVPFFPDLLETFEAGFLESASSSESSSFSPDCCLANQAKFPVICSDKYPTATPDKQDAMGPRKMIKRTMRLAK